MKNKIFLIFLFTTLTTLSSVAQEQEVKKVLTYSWTILDTKNPNFSFEEVKKNLMLIESTEDVEYTSESKRMTVYAVSKITFSQILKEMRKFNLGIDSYKEDVGTLPKK
jgi:hypothetical protein